FIDKIKGRVSDNVKTPSGLIINGAYLTTIFDEFPELIEGFQIIQNKDFSIIVNCVVAEKYNSNAPGFSKIKKQLEKKTNNEVLIHFNFPSELIQDRGKLKFVISELD